MSSANSSGSSHVPQTNLSKKEVHTYAKAMIAAMETPDFQARVRTAMARAPVPKTTEEMMYRYEEVQADYFTHHYNSSAASEAASAEKTQQPAQPEAADTLSAQVASMDLHEEGGAPAGSTEKSGELNGDYIMEQLRKAVSLYKDNETERVITQLCLLVEAKVMALPATVPELKHLYAESVHGHDPRAASMAQDGKNPMPIVNPSPQMMSMMEMAMKTLTPQQRETLERAQRTMMNGSPPSPDDMRDMMMIQMQLGAFMKTMQQFGQMPGAGRGGRGGRGGGMRGGRGGRGK